MKKFLLLVLTGLFPLGAAAGELTGTVSYAGSTEFHQVNARAMWQYGLNWLTGLEAKWMHEDVLKHPTYALKLPVGYTTDAFSVTVAPFFYFKNKSDEHPYQAFGVNGQLVLTLQDDSVRELYSHAYLGASFARQQGLRQFDTGEQTHNYFSQAAYTAGLHKNFFRAFSFEVAGSAFQYPDGITGITAVKGILDQQDLAPLHSFDIVHALPKYAAATRLTWMWPDRKATLYVAYRFGEFYAAGPENPADPEHSALIGNTFAMTESVRCELAYNHLQTVHNKNKRDIFYAQLKFLF